MIYQVTIPIYDELINGSGAGDFEVATDLGAYVSSIAGLMLLVAAIALFVYLVWGGFKYLTAGSDTQQMDSAKSHLTNALVGMVVVALAWAVFAFLSNFLGLSVANGGNGGGGGGSGYCSCYSGGCVAAGTTAALNLNPGDCYQCQENGTWKDLNTKGCGPISCGSCP